MNFIFTILMTTGTAYRVNVYAASRADAWQKIVTMVDVSQVRRITCYDVP